MIKHFPFSRSGFWKSWVLWVVKGMNWFCKLKVSKMFLWRWRWHHLDLHLPSHLHQKISTLDWFHWDRSLFLQVQQLLRSLFHILLFCLHSNWHWVCRTKWLEFHQSSANGDTHWLGHQSKCRYLLLTLSLMNVLWLSQPMSILFWLVAIKLQNILSILEKKNDVTLLNDKNYKNNLFVHILHVIYEINCCKINQETCLVWRSNLQREHFLY